MAARRPPPKSRLCSHDWYKRVSVAESLRPCLSRIQHRERKSDWNHAPSFSNTDFIRTFCANGMCTTSYMGGKAKISHIVERIKHKFVVSDLIINIRFCELFRGLALIPRLYRFFCILRDCQIQTVHASSGCCQICYGEDRARLCAHLSLSITP
jgi:hypothetical protein